jgi:acyl carrier protein
MQSTFERIQEIVADALYVEKDKVTREANLMNDLGAESIDFLDIIFRLEKEFSIKIPKGEVERRARGTLTEDEFAVNGLIQPAGMKSLRHAMPDLDYSGVGPRFFVRDIPTLFTVATFERMVSDRLSGELPSKIDGTATAVVSSVPATPNESVIPLEQRA